MMSTLSFFSFGEHRKAGRRRGAPRAKKNTKRSQKERREHPKNFAGSIIKLICANSNINWR